MEMLRTAVCSVFADMNYSRRGDSVAANHEKTWWQELFATRRNGRMAPFLKGLIVAVAIAGAAVLVALLVVGVLQWAH